MAAADGLERVGLGPSLPPLLRLQPVKDRLAAEHTGQHLRIAVGSLVVDRLFPGSLHWPLTHF